jgi:putative tricarboxylic transport membrane protein
VPSVLSFALVILGFAAEAMAAPAWQPSRNVEIIVSTSPGSGSDSTARFIQKLVVEKKLVESPVTVVNKPGGGGTIGLSYLAQHAGNGHYLLVTSPSLLALQIMGRSAIGYADTTPLAQLGTEAVVFTVRADSTLRSGRDSPSDSKPLRTVSAFRSERLSAVTTTLRSHSWRKRWARIHGR